MFKFFRVNLCICILFFLNNNLIGQPTCFYDSLSFFERQKISTFTVKQSIKSRAFRISTVKFDKNKIYFESQLAGEKTKNYDTSIFVDGIAVSDPKSIISLDNKGRIERIIDCSDKRLNIREFSYADTISKRLLMVVNQVENEYVQTQIYFYDNLRLKKVIETFYSLVNNENKKIWEKAYLYEYGFDNKVSRETINQEGKLNCVSEYSYHYSQN